MVHKRNESFTNLPRTHTKLDFDMISLISDLQIQPKLMASLAYMLLLLKPDLDFMNEIFPTKAVESYK